MDENAKRLCEATVGELALQVLFRQTDRLAGSPTKDEYMLETALVNALYHDVFSKGNALARAVLGSESCVGWMPLMLGCMAPDARLEVWECGHPDCDEYHIIIRSKKADLYTMRFEDGPELDDVVSESAMKKDGLHEAWIEVVCTGKYTGEGTVQ